MQRRLAELEGSLLSSFDYYRALNICELCSHSLDNNLHGLDQNDAWLDEDGTLVHGGICTYCKICRGETCHLKRERECVPGKSGIHP